MQSVARTVSLVSLLSIWSFAIPAAQATDMPVTGGPGGGGFRSDCRGGFLAGFNFRSGAFVDAIAPKCASFIDAQHEFGPRSALMLKGGNGGGPTSKECDRASYVAGIKFGFTRDGDRPKYIDYVELICKAVGGGQETRVCLDTGNGCPDAHPARPSLRAVTQRCSDSEAATGIHGRSGAFVDALGLICGPKSTAMKSGGGTHLDALITKCKITGGTFDFSTHRCVHGGASGGDLGEKIAAFAESKVNRCVDGQGNVRQSPCPTLPAGQVGDGECTHLVQAALAAAGAKPGNFSSEPYDWGTEVGRDSTAPMRRGDIVQLQATTFKGPNGQWGTTGHHTAIVTRVSGATVTLVEQNISGVRAVKVNSYDFSWPHTGFYVVYRAESR